MQTGHRHLQFRRIRAKPVLSFLTEHSNSTTEAMETYTRTVEPYPRQVYTLTAPPQPTQPMHLVPLAWASTHIASLPVPLLAAQLPHLFAAYQRRGGSHIDLRARLHDSSYASGSQERYRKGAVAVIGHFASLLGSAAEDEEPPSLTRFLERKLADGGETKLLRHFASIVHIARSFGCLPALRTTLEHLLLVHARALAARDDWRDLLVDLGTRGRARDEIDARLEDDCGASMDANGSGSELPRGRGFEAALVGRDADRAVREWRGCRSVFAAVEPEHLHGILGRLGEGNTLVPPGAAAEGGVLDPVGGIVCVEIRRLDYAFPHRGGAVLGGRVGEWLARGTRRGWTGSGPASDWVRPDRDEWRD